MKTLVLLMMLFFPGLLMADLTVDDFKVLKQEVIEVNRANSKVSSLLFNENLTEAQFQLLKDSVDRLKKSVDKMEKTINKSEIFYPALGLSGEVGEVYNLIKKVSKNIDNNWYWDVEKNVYWRQLQDGSIETKPVTQYIVSEQGVSC